MRKWFAALLLVALLLPTVALAADVYLYIGDIIMRDGDYLANGASATTKTKPTSGGYAYLEADGWDLHLTLHNFSYTGNGRYYDIDSRAIINCPEFDSEFTIHLEGDNYICAEGNPDEYHLAILGDLDFIDGSVNDSLTIESSEGGISAKRQLRISGGNVKITAGHIAAEVTEGDLRIEQSDKLGTIILRSTNQRTDRPCYALHAAKGVMKVGTPDEWIIVASESSSGSPLETFDSADMEKYDYIKIARVSNDIHELPKTGDESDIVLWLSLAMTSMAALVLISRKKREA